MPEELLPNIFKIHVPLPKNPLKNINSYVFKSEKRNLVIDTGLNRPECQEAMQNGLAELGVEPDRTDFFITHFHADHFALITQLISNESRVFFNRLDFDFIKGWISFKPMLAYAGKNGFPKEDLEAAKSHHPGFRYGPGWIPPVYLVPEGHVFKVGDYRLRTISTPGHTPGHMCLYDEQHKILVSGDHLLIDITPNIQCFSDQGNPLNSYLKSLDKVYKLEVEQVLPGHRRLFKDHKKRIDELKKHHADRAAEVLQVLEASAMTAYQVAGKMTWDLKIDKWEDFPVAQRWFATGEAISHIRLLENQGHIKRASKDGQILYSR
jgi:glyoxylase-like metal-dependent hydrolase (beta-lactamase superfamily II)